MKKTLFFAFFVCSFFAFSQSQSLWKKESAKTVDVKESRRELPTKQIYSLDIEGLKAMLSQAPARGEFSGQSNVIVSFPNADGELERYRVMEASVMHPDLAARYPNIKSYAGQGIDNPSDRIRFSVSPLGLQSMRLSSDKPASFIEPYTNDLSQYTVYKRQDKLPVQDNFECEVTAQANSLLQGNSTSLRNADDGTLRTYRLAVSTTGEYTQYHGGTRALALAAINTTMTRVNGLFENDFNVTMVLIANTDNVIYTNPSTDPYSNGSFNSQVQNTLTNVIGEANYDVGHLFARASDNGNAGCIGCVCVNGQKGSAFTSRSTPEGDPFDVDYVAHELGHQFGGNHTFSFRNEGTNAHFEPGSGTTIMGYAGITGATDVQQNSDPYFHWFTIQQVTNYVKSTSCQTNTNTGNSVPTVNAGLNYTIPKGTPFVLEGTASDADSGDVLTYCWEQADENNAATTYPSTTATTGVAFRSFNPTTDNKRYFPRLQTIKSGATSWQWEAVPNVARILNFRLTVRDNRVGGATNNSDDTRITVNGTAGPFVLNSPNTNVTWDAGTTQTVTWNVAGTTGNGVNAANVDIFLSTDGGDTYPITLASGVPNDGSHDIVVPNNQGSQNRIMVRGSNHIFFDISNANFTIGAPVVCNATTPSGLAASNIGSSTATLSWNAVAGATYDLRYRVLGSSTWTTVAVTGVSSNLTGLNTQTQYEAQVRSKCSGGSNSAYSASVNFTTTEVQLNYCASNGNNVNDEFISRVQLGSIDNSSGAAASGYADFTSQSTVLTKGASNTITITPTWTGTLYNEAYAVWIDYNKDGDFTDAGEQVFSQAPTQATPVSGNFTVPTAAVEGATRMRVSMKYNAAPAPCESFTYGEVEDYTVVIESSGPDTTAPVITLNGSASITLELQETYNELGATATDNVDGDLTSSIVTSGTVNTNIAGTYTVTYSVSDAAGNAASATRTVTVNPDTTAPVITLLGSATVSLTVGDAYTDAGATATDNIDGNLTSNIVVTGAVNTNVAGTYTLTYNVSDAAGNAAIPVVRTVTVNEVSNGCSGGVSLPYAEGFESGIGAWTQSSADDLNWTVDANGTPSNNTGPSSAIEGSNYIFVEASGNNTGYPNKRAIITSPCFDLSSAAEATFSFKYHMFGSTNAGSIALEVSNDEGANWTSLWSQTGNQGNQWLTVNIDLVAYLGSGIQLRFNRLTGGTWQADVAIDDISLTDGGTNPPAGCDTLNFNDYTLNSFSTQDASGANSIGNGGASLTLTNNTWKYIDFPYTVTANTVIELEFSSTSEGEIHGIGFENDNALTSSFYFKFYGTQNYGITNFDNYVSGTRTYVIPVGDSYTGVMDRLVFINDNDAGSGNNSTFTNVKIYETSCPTSRGEVVFGERVDVLGDEDEDAFKMRMYPNPVTNTLYVETVGVENATYRIVNMLGQTVLRGVNSSQIDVTTLDKGVYFLELSTGEVSVSRKFIKQ
ncbi:putative secreted protein (Por secretion system target) [Winogradskyella wandonensis]|uniref:Putative secreted protein (Por secretion system target) n=1 Tax=Winogradskyella wandonensis TaxID=1442586 RepID=A0A4R1KT34_9FLAO|nr:immunoglobulin-like domain-containing protein [Winogradskyella wandonensis]TCK67740.1 putative secreted protein (Por secretion system target) [Winogradskyella wandonensis]